MYCYYESNIFQFSRNLLHKIRLLSEAAKSSGMAEFFALLPVGIMLGRGLFLESPETFRLYFG